MWPRSRGRSWGKETNVIFLLERMALCSVLQLAEAVMPNVTPSMQKVQVRRLEAVVAAVHAQLSKRDADEEIRSLRLTQSLTHYLM